MFYAGIDLLFSILFPILFLVVLGMICVPSSEISAHGIRTTIHRG